jgi:hypothetical protein
MRCGRKLFRKINPGRRGKNVPALRSRLLGIFRLFSSCPVLTEEQALRTTVDWRIANSAAMGIFL